MSLEVGAACPQIWAMLPLHTTQRPCANAYVSGLKAISLIDPEDLLYPVPRYTIPTIAAIAFKPGKAAFFVNMEYFTGRYQERPQYNGGGTIYEHVITFEQKGINVNTDFLRAKLSNRRIHALVTTQDDKQRLVQLVQFEAALDTGNQSAGNKYFFEGRSQRLRPAPHMSTPVSIITPPYVPPVVPPDTGSGALEIVEVTTSLAAHTYQVPAGRLLVAIFILTDAQQYVSIGYTSGASELAGPFEQAANTKVKFGDNWIIPVVNTNIYITGLSGNNTIQICLL